MVLRVVFVFDFIVILLIMMLNLFFMLIISVLFGNLILVSGL